MKKVIRVALIKDFPIRQARDLNAPTASVGVCVVENDIDLPVEGQRARRTAMARPPSPNRHEQDGQREGQDRAQAPSPSGATFDQRAGEEGSRRQLSSQHFKRRAASLAK